MREINETVRTSIETAAPLFWIEPSSQVRSSRVVTIAGELRRPNILEKRRRRRIRMMAR